MFCYEIETFCFICIFKELSVIVSTKRGSNEVKLASDLKRKSSIDLNAKNLFMEQQKWLSLNHYLMLTINLLKPLLSFLRYLYKLVKVSEMASYDENSTPEDFFIGNEQASKLFLHPKISASCYVSRK